VRRSTLPNDHDIGGLQIAVKNAAFVRRVQGVGNLARQPHRFISSNRTVSGTISATGSSVQRSQFLRKTVPENGVLHEAIA
jgi:hypothetical protein